MKCHAPATEQATEEPERAQVEITHLTIHSFSHRYSSTKEFCGIRPS